MGGKYIAAILSNIKGLAITNSYRFLTVIVIS